MSGKIEDFFKLHPFSLKKKNILVMVSGGPDSMLLLDLIYKKYHCLYKSLHLLHVNYHLRGTDSLKDALLVRRQVKKYRSIGGPGLPEGHFAEILSPPQGNTEAWARKIRRQYMKRLVRHFEIDVVMTGHHRDDVVEHFFLKLNQAASPGAFFGFAPKSEDVSGTVKFLMLRPLWYYSKKEIDMLVKTYRVPFRHDHTNFHSVYLRNRLRNKVFPVMDHFFSGWKERYIKSFSYFHVLYRMFERESLRRYFFFQDKFCFIKKTWYRKKEDVKLFLLHEALRRLAKHCRFSYGAVFDIYKKILSGGRVVYEGKGFKIWYAFRALRVTSPGFENDFLQNVKAVNRNFFQERLFEDSGVFKTDENALYCRPCKSKDLIFRSRLPGDRLVVRKDGKKRSGLPSDFYEKTLKKILSNKKIPPWFKQQVVVVTETTGEIIGFAVPGRRESAFLRKQNGFTDTSHREVSALYTAEDGKPVRKIILK